VPQFSHLHCHTQYSILDGAANITQMVKKAAADGMPGVAITDHGNMFGVFEFVNACNKEKIKPIVGCEFYLVEDMSIRSFAGTGTRDKRYHQLLLAKNEIGYKNLTRMTGLAYTEGLFGKYPRIDKELLKRHKEGLIATTCCIGGIVPQTILNKGEVEGEKVFLEWLDIFGEDYYVELQRHNIDNINGSGLSQEDLNQILLKWSAKYNVPAIATNDSHYVDEEDSDMHDTLLCINTASKKHFPIKSDDDENYDGKTRFGFPNNQFFFKTTHQMETLFKDVPQTLENTQQIIDKIELLNLKRDIMMPNFTVPQGYQTQSDYMRYLVYEGAKKRYKELSQDIVDRIELELSTIFQSKFEGYFLVIEDFMTEARKMDVSIGPGRGSAAGSVVSYCLGITQVDPLAYGLLFERFLNPERISFPDIDIDFEDAGRQKVLDYVVEKYGRNNVAQIVTYGTMKEKMAIRDVARALDVSILETNLLAKAVPEHDLPSVLDDKQYPEVRKAMRESDQIKSDAFRNYYKTNDIYKTVIDTAIKLRGSVRNTGVHACGVIIAPEDLKELIPLSTAKDSLMLVTQYDKDIVEKVGLLKMDFLGLKTLSILKDIMSIIKARHGVEIDIETIPLDDPAAYVIFQDGNTDGIFQFESDGMKSNLRGLKPDRFFDLIAMNALYRPGPMDYIPNYIARKHGREDVSYDIEASKEILEETYGIMVYHEQVMRLSQLLANFTKGQADTLRKAMGKKDKEVMDKLFDQFIDGCVSNGHDKYKAKKIWTDMEKFAQYAFNKSHSTCYALIAYQSAYLKAKYPSEFMAGLMSNNMDKTEDIKKYIQVSKKMGIEVLGPDVNESNYIFTVNDKGHIRFGLSAIKGVGENVIKEMVAFREKDGAFADVFDFVSRLGTKNANKKVLEALAISGALDCFEDIKREQYFGEVDNQNFIEKLIKFANDLNKSSTDVTTNIFGDSFQDMIQKPTVPTVPPFTELERLEKEKEVLGLYMSGHPLDKYRKFIQDVTVMNFEEVKITKKWEYIVGLVKDITQGEDNKGKTYKRFNLLGLDSVMQFAIKDKVCEEFGRFIEDGAAIMMRVKWDSFTSKAENKVIEFMKTESIIPESKIYGIVNSLILGIDITDTQLETIAKLEYVCKSHFGNTPVILSLDTPQLESIMTNLNDEINPEESIQNLDEEGEVIEEIQTVKYNSLTLKSMAYKVNLNENFFTELFDVVNEQKVKLAV
jgi:DNA polymerase III subunit alpha